MKKLYDKQQLTIDKAINHSRFIIRNDARTGKTFTSLNLILQKAKKDNIDLENEIVLIIVPHQTILNWKSECEIVFKKEPYVLNFFKTKKQRENLQKIKKGIFIVGHASLRTHKEWLYYRKFWFTIIDEAHEFGHHNTQKTKIATLINARSVNLVLLSASAAANNPQKFYFILNILNNSVFRSFKSYKDLYCILRTIYVGGGRKVEEVIDWTPDGLKQIQSFLSPIQTQYCLEDMGIKILWNEQSILITPTPQQKEIYQKMNMQKEMFMPNGAYKSFFSNSWYLSRLNILYQICHCPEMLGIKSNIIESIQELLLNNPTKKFIFSCKYSGYLEKILKPNILYSEVINGKVSLEDRQKIIQQFNENKIQHLICQEKTIGTGIHLNKADAIVFLTIPWDPVQKDQIRARISTLITSEQKNSVKDVYFFVLDNNFSRKIYETVIIHKTNVLDKINKKEFNDDIFML